MRILKTAKYTKLAQVSGKDYLPDPSKETNKEQPNGFRQESQEDKNLPTKPPAPQTENTRQYGYEKKDWATLKNVKEVDRILQNIQLGSGECGSGANGVVNSIKSITTNPLIEEDVKRKFVEGIEAAYGNLDRILTEADNYYQNKKMEIVQNLGNKESQDYHQYVSSVHDL